VFPFLVLGLALLGSACVRRVNVNELLPPSANASTDELINRVNSFSEVQTFSGQVDILFRDYLTGEGSIAKEFPEATGLIVFKRPENTRMRVTFSSIKVADMSSDGQKFRLAVFRPEDKRRFFYGSNLKEIERMDAEDIRDFKDPRLAQAGGLVNMRPQHVTDSFLIKPINEGDRLNVFREEVRQVEPDGRAGKKNRLVERSYYVLYVLDKDDKGQLKLRRKFWFDRTDSSLPLTRQQTFENGVGRLASDVAYSNWLTVPNTKYQLPGKVVIDRRQMDGYRLELKLLPDTVEINSEMPDSTFILENVEHLQEFNLDAPRKAAAKPDPKLPANR
jgi:hypothetical protein